MSTPNRGANDAHSLNLLATSSSIELGHHGFLKFHTTVDGVSSGASIRRFFAISEQGLLLHAENQQLVRSIPLYHILLVYLPLSSNFSCLKEASKARSLFDHSP